MGLSELMAHGKKRPEWVPEDGDVHHFATGVMPGVAGGHDGMPGSSVGQGAVYRPQLIRRRHYTADDYAAGVLSGDRVLLARAITLIESHLPAHMDMAQKVLRRCLPQTGRSLRIGITGVPGAGKSTFIEALGMMLCRRGHKVAVLAVDPSSTRSGGSILGDKTRMEELSREPKAFIRPSPAGGTLGGVARKSRETLLLCEAAGHDVILVETVGVGQSEVTVRSMVDFFLLLQITGGGDELQGIKKGVIELADAIAVNKADGDNLPRARAAQAEFNRILRHLQPATEGWESRAYTCSALSGEGVEALWEVFQEFIRVVRENGVMERRRREQRVAWMHSLIEEGLRQHFYGDKAIAESLKSAESAVARGEEPVTDCVRRLLEGYLGSR